MLQSIKNNPTMQSGGDEVKSAEEIALIAKDIINMLAEKNCTVEVADNVLRIARRSIDSTTKVRKLEY